MSKLYYIIVLFLTFVLACKIVHGDVSTTSNLLWPQPSHMDFGDANTAKEIDPDMFTVSTDCTSIVLTSAIKRYQDIIFNAPIPFYPFTDVTTNGHLESLLITVKSDDESLNDDTDESYDLSINSTAATIIANTVYGAIRGLETFSQLVYHTEDGQYTISGVVDIKDTPRFSYRGIMIDTSRHFLNVHTILEHLDAMSYNKYNVLHWHIVDDQSFPYQSVNFPDLSAKGAYDSRHVFDQQDVETVVKYAKERGIRVIPEFDTPGHTQSWGKGQPNLLTPCYTNNKPNGQYGPINPILDSTWTFMNQFYKEISEVFPDDYIHLGGDEVSFSCWESNPDITAWLKKNEYNDTAKVEEYYENNLVNNLNKSYVVWQEIFDNKLRIKMDTIIDIWKGTSNWQNEMKAVTSSGYKAILSSCWYLNYISYGPDWHQYYSCDPQNFNGTDAEMSNVIGGHACLWGEYVDSTNFMPRMWPRASAVAERLWSPKTVVSLSDASVRFDNQRCRLLSRGIRAEPASGPGYCNTEWNGP